MIFRPQALTKVTDPDQLDSALRIVRPRHVLGFGVVAGILVAGLIWSMLSTAPVKVSGQGVLLSPLGLAAITALDAGHIDQLLVRTGDRVTVGQTIALLRRPERLDELQAAESEARDVGDRYQALQEEFAVQDRHRDELMARLRAASEDRVKSLDAQAANLDKRRMGEAQLRDKGMVSAVNLYETDTQLAQVRHDLATARNRITELDLEHQQQADKRHQELAEVRIQSQTLTRKAANLRRDYERDRQVLATAPGTVAEIGLDVDDPVAAGQVIARLLVDDAAGETRLTAIAYLPAADGKKVKADMSARVSPSTTRVELDGYVLGRVVRVADLPASREAMANRLKNATLADEILKQAGTPIQIEVELQRAADTPSGYAWSSGKGPTIRIEPGTLARTEVVVERVHIISLMFPAMDYVFGWFRTL